MFVHAVVQCDVLSRRERVDSDHAGFEAKNELFEYVRDQLKCKVEDCGALVNDPQDDYPGIVAVAAKRSSEDDPIGARSQPAAKNDDSQCEAARRAAAARKRSIARPSSRKTASTILNEIQQFSALQ
jgi:hypothetical protein